MKVSVRTTHRKEQLLTLFQNQSHLIKNGNQNYVYLGSDSDSEVYLIKAWTIKVRTQPCTTDSTNQPLKSQQWLNTKEKMTNDQEH